MEKHNKIRGVTLSVITIICTICVLAQVVMIHSVARISPHKVDYVRQPSISYKVDEYINSTTEDIHEQTYIIDMGYQTEKEKLFTTIQAMPVPTEVLEEQARYDEDSDLYILAHIINGEAGSDYCTDEMRRYVGSVVLNRVKSDYFPNTIKEVAFQRGQYACTWDGNYNKEVSETCWQIASELLHDGSVLPDNVVFQAQFVQGSGVHIQLQNIYFCYQ